MQHKRQQRWALALFAAMVSSVAVAASPVTGLSKVGSGQMDWLFFSVYDASLYTASGQYPVDDLPLALQITYRKDIKRQHLIEATQEQWQHLGIKPAPDWLQILADTWPNVKSGDVLTFVVQADDSNMFYLNDKAIGAVPDSQFSADFLAIWLSDKTSRPELRQQLIGAK
jgi:hypothetical protein